MERRHSLDIVLDFKALMQARKAQLEDRQQRENHTTTSAICPSVKTESMHQVLNETQQQNADESFDALERMCDKTGSDPDSTLFQYLNSDDKEKVLALAKERSTRADNSSDMEMCALRRMLDDVGDQDQLCNESPLKSAECTQLEDIEAPSRLWDNDFTINGNDSVFQANAQTSPVKMVGLMRPSTILEANEADLTADLQSDGSSSHNSSSFMTAHTLKTAQSSETIASGSSCYETAGDNSLASSSKEATTLSVDDLFYAAIAKAKPHGMSKGEQQELLGDLHETLMDLAVNDAADSTIIELSSSGEEEEDEDQAVKEGNDLNADIKQEESSLIDSEAEEEDKENKSIHLNGTMEEMEYMMQKAREYMAAKETSPSPSPAKTTSDPDVIHLHRKLPKQNTFLMTPQKGASSPLHQGASSKLPTGPCKSRYAINMDPPKTKFFKQPSAIPMRRELKVQRDHFAHIVSPIRTYTQKSGTAPLMSMFREKPNINDVFNKMSIKELEEESRLCQLKRGQTVASDNCNLSKLTPGCIDPAARLLPKKAYISSELKQVVDERTPMPMPNVPKIQKYLDSAVEPTVLRHDGKMKLPTQSNSSSSRNTSHIPRRPNQSLADLSLASGDISLYTLKDAQKF
ncbi:uncharacterized protein LOC115760083 isoform X2 [Drosophila novamexicana]|nr:uncharacterized protein LOC115760083 isoform X2 [Drosophila novamexicana]